ncbi:MAG: NUDIX domain-containing protein [Candidatus Ventricola sp.]
MICRTHPLGSLTGLQYVVVLSHCGGRILLSRHRERTTWETQGGHIEPGETPEQAARRELYEESGALRYAITPLCDYWAGDGQIGKGASGRVFAAEIEELGPLPASEMAEARLFDALPDELTYPAITPVLFAHWGGKAAHDDLTKEEAR